MSNNEVKLMMVGDVHVSDTPPSTRTASYRDDILMKLIELRDKSVQFDAAVFVGDIFHSKKPAKTSHQTVQAVGRILNGFECPVYIVPGNHDYAARHPENLSKHPLGTLALLDNIRLFGTDGKIHRDVVLFAGGNTGFNYDQSWPVLRLWGVREEEGLDAFKITPMSGNPSLPTLIVAHSAIFPPGRTPGMWEAFDANEVAEAIAGPGFVWYGHIHEPHGVYSVEDYGDEVIFANLGAISRGSMHEEGAMDRTPAWGALTLTHKDGEPEPVWTVEEHPFECAKPAAEVFRVAEVTAERERSAESTAFADALSEASIEVFSVETAIQAISQHPEATQPVKDRAIELIEEVR